MKKKIIFFLFNLLFVNLYSVETGNLFIISESGYRIYIDKELVGVTSNEQGGLWIKDLEVGSCKVKAEKINNPPIFFTVDIVAGKTIEKKISTNYEIKQKKEIKGKILFDGIYHFPIKHGHLHFRFLAGGKVDNIACIEFIPQLFDKDCWELMKSGLGEPWQDPRFAATWYSKYEIKGKTLKIYNSNGEDIYTIESPQVLIKDGHRINFYKQ